jgi:hypothetical protein
VFLTEVSHKVRAYLWYALGVETIPKCVARESKRHEQVDVDFAPACMH